MQQVTIITPIAPHHKDVFVRCADSVRAQTVQCRHLHMVDEEMRGPAYIRNLLLKQVKTPYVVFLDADDYLEPEFTDQCLRYIPAHGYTYTDWYMGDTVASTPDGAFWKVAWHLVTCLLHTDMVRFVGGFDETLPVMEDTKLFLEFDRYDYCGTKIPFPLVHYTDDGMRGKEGRKSGAVKKVKAELSRRYKVGCCGGKAANEPNRKPQGSRMANDVLVMPLWEGNRNIIGMITGRRYKRASRPMRIWMGRKDAQARPDLFRIIPQTKPKVKPPKADRQQDEKLSNANTLQSVLVNAGMLFVPPARDKIPVAANTEIKPDFKKLNVLAKGIYEDGKEKKEDERGQGNTHRITRQHTKADSGATISISQ